VEGLDMFQLPTYTLSIQIDSVRYNSVTRQLEITMKNNVELATYFKGTYPSSTATSSRLSATQKRYSLKEMT
jgi:hypothetical protein